MGPDTASFGASPLRLQDCKRARARRPYDRGGDDPARVFLFVSTVRLFAIEGEGTLAPWDPPRKLVVRGPYRYLRQPMISGVALTLAGEALVFSSTPVRGRG